MCCECALAVQYLNIYLHTKENLPNYAMDLYLCRGTLLLPLSVTLLAHALNLAEGSLLISFYFYFPFLPLLPLPPYGPSLPTS